MERGKLKLYSFLGRRSESHFAAFNGSCISIPKGETELEKAWRLTSETRTWETFFDEVSQRIGNEIIVIHNGQVVNDPWREER